MSWLPWREITYSLTVEGETYFTIGSAFALSSLTAIPALRATISGEPVMLAVPEGDRLTAVACGLYGQVIGGKRAEEIGLHIPEEMKARMRAWVEKWGEEHPDTAFIPMAGGKLTLNQYKTAVNKHMRRV